MPTHKIELKHNNKTIIVEVPEDGTLGDLKAIIARETNVPPAMQKLMGNAKLKCDDEKLSAQGIKAVVNNKLMLIGSPVKEVVATNTSWSEPKKEERRQKASCALPFNEYLPMLASMLKSEGERDQEEFLRLRVPKNASKSSGAGAANGGLLASSSPSSPAAQHRHTVSLLMHSATSLEDGGAAASASSSVSNSPDGADQTSDFMTFFMDNDDDAPIIETCDHERFLLQRAKEREQHILENAEKRRRRREAREKDLLLQQQQQQQTMRSAAAADDDNDNPTDRMAASDHHHPRPPNIQVNAPFGSPLEHNNHLNLNLPNQQNQNQNGNLSVVVGGTAVPMPPTATTAQPASGKQSGNTVSDDADDLNSSRTSSSSVFTEHESPKSIDLEGTAANNNSKDTNAYHAMLLMESVLGRINRYEAGVLQEAIFAKQQRLQQQQGGGGAKPSSPLQRLQSGGGGGGFVGSPTTAALQGMGGSKSKTDGSRQKQKSGNTNADDDDEALDHPLLRFADLKSRIMSDEFEAAGDFDTYYEVDENGQYVYHEPDFEDYEDETDNPRERRRRVLFDAEAAHRHGMMASTSSSVVSGGGAGAVGGVAGMASVTSTAATTAPSAEVIQQQAEEDAFRDRVQLARIHRFLRKSLDFAADAANAETHEEIKLMAGELTNYVRRLKAGEWMIVPSGWVGQASSSTMYLLIGRSRDRAPVPPNAADAPAAKKKSTSSATSTAAASSGTPASNYSFAIATSDANLAKELRWLETHNNYVINLAELAEREREEEQRKRSSDDDYSCDGHDADFASAAAAAAAMYHPTSGLHRFQQAAAEEARSAPLSTIPFGLDAETFETARQRFRSHYYNQRRRRSGTSSRSRSAGNAATNPQHQQQNASAVVPAYSTTVNNNNGNSFDPTSLAATTATSPSNCPPSSHYDAVASPNFNNMQSTTNLHSGVDGTGLGDTLRNAAATAVGAVIPSPTPIAVVVAQQQQQHTLPDDPLNHSSALGVRRDGDERRNGSVSSTSTERSPYHRRHHHHKRRRCCSLRSALRYSSATLSPRSKAQLLCCCSSTTSTHHGRNAAMMMGSNTSSVFSPMTSTATSTAAGGGGNNNANHANATSTSSVPQPQQQQQQPQIHAHHRYVVHVPFVRPERLFSEEFWCLVLPLWMIANNPQAVLPTYCRGELLLDVLLPWLADAIPPPLSAEEQARERAAKKQQQQQQQQNISGSTAMLNAATAGGGGAEPRPHQPLSDSVQHYAEATSVPATLRDEQWMYCPLAAQRLPFLLPRDLVALLAAVGPFIEERPSQKSAFLTHWYALEREKKTLQLEEAMAAADEKRRLEEEAEALRNSCAASPKSMSRRYLSNIAAASRAGAGAGAGGGATTAGSPTGRSHPRSLTPADIHVDANGTTNMDMGSGGDNAALGLVASPTRLMASSCTSLPSIASPQQQQQHAAGRRPMLSSTAALHNTANNIANNTNSAASPSNFTISRSSAKHKAEYETRERAVKEEKRREQQRFLMRSPLEADVDEEDWENAADNANQSGGGGDGSGMLPNAYLSSPSPAMNNSSTLNANGQQPLSGTTTKLKIATAPSTAVGPNSYFANEKTNNYFSRNFSNNPHHGGATKALLEALHFLLQVDEDTAATAISSFCGGGASDEANANGGGNSTTVVPSSTSSFAIKSQEILKQIKFVVKYEHFVKAAEDLQLAAKKHMPDVLGSLTSPIPPALQAPDYLSPGASPMASMLLPAAAATSTTSSCLPPALQPAAAAASASSGVSGAGLLSGDLGIDDDGDDNDNPNPNPSAYNLNLQQPRLDKLAHGIDQLTGIGINANAHLPTLTDLLAAMGPNDRLKTAAGVLLTPEQFTHSCRVIVVYFTAAWSEPCKRVAGMVINAYRKLQERVPHCEKKLEFLLISCDRTKEAHERYVEKFPFPRMTWPDESILRPFDLKEVPQILVFAPDGHLMTQEGVDALLEDPEALRFPNAPWNGAKPLSRSELQILEFASTALQQSALERFHDQYMDRQQLLMVQNVIDAVQEVASAMPHRRD